MDPNSTKYDPEGSKVIQENEYLRRKVEELEMDIEEQKQAEMKKKPLMVGDTFESVAKRRKEELTK
jgi:hypothetical protein